MRLMCHHLHVHSAAGCLRYRPAMCCRCNFPLSLQIHNWSPHLHTRDPRGMTDAYTLTMICGHIYYAAIKSGEILHVKLIRAMELDFLSTENRA